MAEYYECGKGWEPLILRAEAIVCKYNQEHPDDEQIEFTQIKEKFGQLRLYIWPHIKEVDSQLRELENQSSNICEECGKPAQRIKYRNWLYTLCGDCLNRLSNHE